MLTEGQLAALNVEQEADGEPDDGKAAVMRVVLNRMRRKYFSDGTITNTVLAYDQFSWAYFAFEACHTGTATHPQSKQEYERICYTPADAAGRAEDLFDMAHPSDIAHCSIIAQQVIAGTYRTMAYAKMTDDAVLYLNPRILTKLPTWAIPKRLICSIGHHDFYRSDDPPLAIAA